MPRAGPRNMRVFDATTNTLTIGWDHAEGPVNQYKISYAPLTGDPITEFVSPPHLDPHLSLAEVRLTSV